jgi:hypothetical protein
MPSRRQHLDQWDHNRSIARDLEQQGVFDWAATVLAYAALHLIDAHFAGFTPPIHPRSHSDRNRRIATDSVISEVYNDYRELMDRSRDARYDCITFHAGDIALLRASSFDSLERYVRTVLSI